MGSKILIMPDVHAGAGCTIGTTMTIKDSVVPNLVDVDIGCGMETIKIKKRGLRRLYKIHGQVPQNGLAH
jgi:tRNA-splicing ligase RtcB (3'-phosphate/5'-hydroxy nucleic acid ligase)